MITFSYEETVFLERIRQAYLNDDGIKLSDMQRFMWLTEGFESELQGRDSYAIVDEMRHHFIQMKKLTEMI